MNAYSRRYRQRLIQTCGLLRAGYWREADIALWLGVSTYSATKYIRVAQLIDPAQLIHTLDHH